MGQMSKPRFLLLYGSQTGQAKAIAEEIYENSEANGFISELHCLSETERKFDITREPCVVMIVSTTGEGEPPETACKFFRRIRKRTLPNDYLMDMNYALLGLGDTNYTNFCNSSKTLEKAMRKLGAKSFLRTAFADDAVGLEVVADPWMDELWAALQTFFKIYHVNNKPSLVETAKCSSTPNSSTGVKTTETDSPSIVATRGSSETGLPVDEMPKPDPSGFRQNPETVDATTTLNANKPDENKVENNVEIGTSAETPEVSPLPDGSTGAVVIAVDGTDDRHEPSLSKSLPPLSEVDLSVPQLPVEYLFIEYSDDDHCDVEKLPIQNGNPFPSCDSPVYEVPVVNVTQLTRDDALKKTLHFELDIKETGMHYEPGDSISVICPNDSTDVQRLIDRLGLTDTADHTYQLTVNSGSTRKSTAIPGYIPTRATVRHVLGNCIDIRTITRKAFLRMLAHYTTDPMEQRRLLELSSKQGSSDFAKYIREPNLVLYDLLHVFPSCKPTVNRLFEMMPRLQPRPYSASSSLLAHPDRLHFTFNVVDVPELTQHRLHRYGVCTRWLDVHTKSIQPTPIDDDDDSISDITRLSITETETMVKFFKRPSIQFRLPRDPSTPMIMIGPGTGLAPFIGFLSHRHVQLAGGTLLGESVLFYGCRHEHRDYLYRKELEDFVSAGTLTRLFVSFSRDEPLLPGEPHLKYVQDNISQNWQTLGRMLVDDMACVYVCGDARNMAKDVNAAIVAAVQKYKCCSHGEAMGFLIQMRSGQRYLEDVWT